MGQELVDTLRFEVEFIGIDRDGKKSDFLNLFPSNSMLSVRLEWVL